MPVNLLDRITLSIGISGFAPPEHASDAEALITSADEALYRAKKEGRDQNRDSVAIRPTFDNSKITKRFSEGGCSRQLRDDLRIMSRSKGGERASDVQLRVVEWTTQIDAAVFPAQKLQRLPGRQAVAVTVKTRLTFIEGADGHRQTLFVAPDFRGLYESDRLPYFRPPRRSASEPESPAEPRVTSDVLRPASEKKCENRK